MGLTGSRHSNSMCTDGRIFDLAQGGDQLINQFLERYIDQSEEFFAKIEAVRSANSVKEEIGKGNAGHIFLAQHGQDLEGLLLYERKEWDTNHFGVRIGNILSLLSSSAHSEREEIQLQILHCLEESNIDADYLVTRVPSDDLPVVSALETAGFHLLTVMVTLLLDPRKAVLTGAGCPAVGEYERRDLATLQEIAGSCFHSDRFHSEVGFPREKSDELHIKWVTNCCEAGLADHVIVARLNGIPVGFNACKIDHSLKEALNIVLGSIVLIGVHPEAQGRGIGSALVEASVKWFSDKCDYLQVRTELANHAAIRMYQKVGFAIVESSIYYRKWVHVKDSTP